MSSNTFFADHLLLVRQMAQVGIAPKAFLGAFGMEFPAVIRELGPPEKRSPARPSGTPWRAPTSRRRSGG